MERLGVLGTARGKRREREGREGRQSSGSWVGGKEVRVESQSVSQARMVNEEGQGGRGEVEFGRVKFGAVLGQGLSPASWEVGAAVGGSGCVCVCGWMWVVGGGWWELSKGRTPEMDDNKLTKRRRLEGAAREYGCRDRRELQGS